MWTLITIMVVMAVSYFFWQKWERGHALDDDEPQVVNKKENDKEQTITINVKTKTAMNGNYDETMDVPTLVRTMLGKLNCQYDENDDGSLFFTYQGERFWLTSSKESVWIRIVDVQWYECPLDNLEEMSCMQKAINLVNGKQSCTAVYLIDKEIGKMIVYSKCDLIISPKFPSPDQYLAAWLACFFRLKQDVVIEFEKEKQKIGLSTN